MNTTPDPRMQGYQQQQPVNSEPYQGQTYGVGDETVQSANMGNAYAESGRERYVDSSGNQIESTVETFEDRNQSRANSRYWTTTITYYALGVLDVILFLRLLLRILGANQNNGFVTFLYGFSHLFVAAFNGIFNDQALGQAGVFEISTLVAMLVYALIAWGIVSLGRVVFAPRLPGHQSVRRTRRQRL